MFAHRLFTDMLPVGELVQWDLEMQVGAKDNTSGHLDCFFFSLSVQARIQFDDFVQEGCVLSLDNLCAWWEHMISLQTYLCDWL